MGKSDAWSTTELNLLSDILDENPENARVRSWAPLAMEFFARAPSTTRRSKGAIVQRLRVMQDEREFQAERELMKTAREPKPPKPEKEQKSDEEVQRVLRQDKAVAQLHSDLMRETARLISNYNKIVDACIICSQGLYKDSSGKDTLKLDFRTLNRTLRALEPDLYQMRVDELKGK